MGFEPVTTAEGSNQSSGKEHATTDTKPRNGMGVSDNSARLQRRNYPRQ